jgi:putative intracellular protease/amidase
MTDRILEPVPSLAGRAGRGLLRAVGLHPDDALRAPSRVADARALVIASSHGVLDIGVATGVFASELTVPWYVFQDAGLSVDVASIEGGIVPIDPLSMKEPIRSPGDDRMLADPRLRAQLMNALPIAALDFTAYDIVFLAGGWGAAFDFGQSDVLGRRISEAYAAGRILGGICHGPLGLLRARRPDGKPLVQGRRLTAVTDRQIAQLGITLTPLHPESALRAAGARFESHTHVFRDFFANHYVVDGDLITGQNQNAGPMVARLMLERVVEKRAGAQPCRTPSRRIA